MVDPLSYFSFQPVLHDWCNKDRGVCYHVCGMVHIKEPLLLIGKSSLCGVSGFPLSLSVCVRKQNVLSASLNKTFPSFLSRYLNGPLPLCPTPYNRKQNVLSASLNKTFPSFLSRYLIGPLPYVRRHITVTKMS